MAPSTSSTITIGAVAGSTLLLTYASLRMLISKADPAITDGELDDVPSEKEFITPEDVCKVFDTIFMQMQNAVAQLTQYIQQVQMAGKQIPEEQLQMMLKTEFENILSKVQAKVFEEVDVDEDCIEEATWEFMAEPEKYPKVVKAVERFQRLYERISGQKVVGIRTGDAQTAGVGDRKGQDLSPEKLLEAAKIFFDAITETMVDIVKKYKSEGKNLHDPAVVQGLQMQFASLADEVGEAALKRMDLTMEDFHGAVEKHKNHPEVGRTLMMLQIQQQQTLIAAGLPAPMG